jgi:hypothetical protein
LKSEGVKDVFKWLEQKCKEQKKEVDELEDLCRGSWGFLYRNSDDLLRAKERLQAYVDIKVGVEKYMKKLKHQGE